MSHPNMRMRPRPRETRTQPGRRRQLTADERELFVLLRELQDQPQTGRHAAHQEDTP